MPSAELSGGALNAALANELGKLIADFTGRGAQRSRAFLHQDVVICVLEDGATNAEKNLAAAGKADLVRMQRDALQRAMAPQLIAAVERLTHRTVRTFLSGTDGTGGSSVEAFVLDPEPTATPTTSNPQTGPPSHEER
ncbi:MAG TPA: Na-translocating system protein MpsC family protein [Solirubrobacteraceae bacterium]|nr:Na-translocating system protein MpsC family protein [Solirubrobacteraceae bacterium]